MQLTFRLRYHSRFGQSLWLTGSHPLLGGGEIDKAVPLRYLDEECWQGLVELPPDAAGASIRYDYLLRNADGSQVMDWGRDRLFVPSEFNCEELLVIDSWNNPGDAGNVFYTEPFRNVLLRGNFTEVRAPVPASPTHTFQVKAPLLAKGQTLCLLGEGPALGNWSATKPLLLNRMAGQNDLTVQMDLRGQPFPLAYKYGVFDLEKNALIRYEDGPNRVLNDVIAPNRHTLVNDGFIRLPADTWKGAGVAIPVFSLRSKKGFGVGEFEDLKLLADWCRQVGLKLIQILPVNDTTATHTWMDSYPYSAISAFALHPIYLNLNRVASGANKKLLKELEPERARLNALEAVDYEAVLKAKLDFIKRIFPSQKTKTFASEDYRQFFSQNRHWLEPYAAFCHLRDEYGTSDFNQWPAFRSYQAEAVARLVAGNSPVHDEIALCYFIQYHLHLQLKDAAEYAHNAGVVLKGDIAIGVYGHGSDVWREPELFHIGVQAGAPPDAFAVKGQNWGFPTYNWERMKADGFAWWKRRFEQMSRYFDAFRIDHILGFFRIWSIPAHAVEGIMGYFVPAIPVEPREFEKQGMPFDYSRFTRPYITDKVLRELFGDEAEAVRNEFLTVARNGHYSLKSEFATQRQVDIHFASGRARQRAADLNEHGRVLTNPATRQGLFDLISNVILFDISPRGEGRVSPTGSPGSVEQIPAPGDASTPITPRSEWKLHFRFGMEQIPSFNHLPADIQAKLKALYVDYFFRRQDHFWMGEAMLKLPALKRVTNMLVCGEDLGLVPACVPGVMKDLGLLGLEIQRMPKRLGQEFSRPADAPYLSVVTPSSHDMSTIRGWWEEDRKRTQKFYNQELGQHGDAPRQCASWINKAVVLQHLASPAIWSIFQLQDLLGMDEKLRRADPHAERINVPANPRHYWRYRMHLPVEMLQQADGFNRELRWLIEQDGR